MPIVVPTDFSECAHDAFHTACQIAQLKAEPLHLLHAADLPEHWEKLATEETSTLQNITTSARNQLEQLQTTAQKQGISCEYHFANSRLLPKLVALVEELDAGLVVMGSHGTSGKQEWLMGSNAQKAVRALRTKLLIVKHKIDIQQFSEVLFATGLFVDDQEALQHMLDFLQPFPVQKIHLLAVRTNSLFGPPAIVMQSALTDFANLITDYNVETHYHPDLTVERGIRDFITAHNISLVALSNHRRQPLKRFFQGSNVEMLVNHADVPVLTIDYPISDGNSESIGI